MTDPKTMVMNVEFKAVVPCPHCDGDAYLDIHDTYWCIENLSAGRFPARFSTNSKKEKES